MPRSAILLTLLLLTTRCICAEGTPPAPDSLRVTRIRELMDLTGASGMGEMILENMGTSFRQNGLSLTDGQWADYRAKADVEGLLSSLVPVYDQYYTDEELTVLLDLYRTPMGRTVLAKSQAVMQGSVELGRAWGDAVAGAILSDLQEKGLIMRQKAPAATGTPTEASTPEPVPQP